LIEWARNGRLDRMGLSEQELAILEFEGSWWTVPGPKEAAIRDRFRMSPSSYRKVLARLIESDEAVSADPLLIRRLRRDRDRRRRARFEGRPTGDRKV
jgi:DNA-binding MarR family transcriptional regulator